MLGMLSIRPMSGYDIKKAVEGSINYFWTESYGQIYPMLKSLVAERLVTKTVKKQAGRPDRHVYTLTAGGRKELHTWLTGRVMPTVERNELLLKLFFGEENSIPVNVKHIEEYRKIQTELHEAVTTIERTIRSQHTESPDAPYWLMTVNYGKKISKARLDWCDETLAKLNKMARANNRNKK
jgi:PadR family transcriptional regulator, regulatory protein AphA